MTMSFHGAASATKMPPSAVILVRETCIAAAVSGSMTSNVFILRNNRDFVLYQSFAWKSYLPSPRKMPLIWNAYHDPDKF